MQRDAGISRKRLRTSYVVLRTGPKEGILLLKLSQNQISYFQNKPSTDFAIFKSSLQPDDLFSNSGLHQLFTFQN